MLGSSKPVVFDRYASQRRRWRVPRWLVLLLAGSALGAGSVLLVQERYLPPRLSAQASTELRSAFETAERERVRLSAQLGDTSKRLDSALTDKKALETELTTQRETIERLREDVAALVASLPSDPRGGAVEVRAARFSVQGGQLAYDVVLSRDKRSAARPLTGVMQLVLTGDSARRAGDTVTLSPIQISVSNYDSVRGSLPLPEGFKPRQTTIYVLDRVGGKRLGMRVVNVA